MQKQDNQSQLSRFVETVRALGCDEDKERFESRLGEIAAHKPVKEPPMKPAKKAK